MLCVFVCVCKCVCVCVCVCLFRHREPHRNARRCSFCKRCIEHAAAESIALRRAIEKRFQLLLHELIGALRRSKSALRKCALIQSLWRQIRHNERLVAGAVAARRSLPRHIVVLGVHEAVRARKHDATFKIFDLYHVVASPAAPRCLRNVVRANITVESNASVYRGGARNCREALTKIHAVRPCSDRASVG